MFKRRKNIRTKLGNSADFILCRCWSSSFICYTINEVNLSRKWKIPTASLKTMPMMPLAGLESPPQWRRPPQPLSFSPVSPVLVYLTLDLCPDILGWPLRHEWLRIISQECRFTGTLKNKKHLFLFQQSRKRTICHQQFYPYNYSKTPLAEPVNDSRIVGAPAGIWTRVRDFLSLSSAERPLYMVPK